MRGSRLRFLWMTLLLLLLPGCKGCNNGVGKAHQNPLPDGTVILLRGTNGFGALILRNQASKDLGLPTEEVSLAYEWFFQPDGKGTFATKDPQVVHGIVPKSISTRMTQFITFQEFSVEWSGNTNGFGWIYYPHDFHTFIGSADWSMCVTDQTNVAGIKPGDWRWSYSTRPPFSLTQEWNWLKGQLGSTGR